MKRCSQPATISCSASSCQSWALAPLHTLGFSYAAVLKAKDSLRWSTRGEFNQAELSSSQMEIGCCSHSTADTPSSSKDKLLTLFQDHKDTEAWDPGCLAIPATSDALITPIWVRARHSSSSLLPLLVTPACSERQPRPPTASGAWCSPGEVIPCLPPHGAQSPDAAGVLAREMSLTPTTAAWPQVASATCSSSIWAAPCMGSCSAICLAVPGLGTPPLGPWRAASREKAEVCWRGS